MLSLGCRAVREAIARQNRLLLSPARLCSSTSPPEQQQEAVQGNTSPTRVVNQENLLQTLGRSNITCTTACSVFIGLAGLKEIDPTVSSDQSFLNGIQILESNKIQKVRPSQVIGGLKVNRVSDAWWMP